MESAGNKTAPGDYLNNFFWQAIPACFNRWFPGAAGKGLADGSYLAHFIKPIYLFPVILFFVGLLIGGDHFGFESGYPDSLSSGLVIFMLILAVWGAGFGFWLWLGYTLADLFIFSYNEFAGSGYYSGSASFTDNMEGFLAHYFLPKTIICALLYFLLVLTPAFADNLRVKITGGKGTETIDKALLNVGLYAVLLAFLTWCWAKMVPSLVSPVYNWRGQDCPHPAAQSLYINTSDVVWVALVLGLLRFYIQHIRVKQKNQPAAVFYISFNNPGPFTLRKIITVVIKSILTVFLLCGLMVVGNDEVYISRAWHLAFISLAVVLAINFFKAYFSSVKAGKNWAGIVQRLPFVIRLALCFIIAYFIAQYILSTPFDSSDAGVRISYMTYMLAAIFVSMLLFYFFLPDLGAIAPAGQKPLGGSKKLLAAAVFMITFCWCAAAFAGTFCVIDPNVYDKPKKDIPGTTTAIALTLTLAAAGGLKRSVDADGNVTITIDPDDHTASITAMGQGGTPDYTYTWVNNSTGESGTGDTITDPKPGTYSITATDSKGNTVTKQAIVKYPDKGDEKVPGGNDDDVG